MGKKGKGYRREEE
jgi:hypothetical protein